MLGRGWFPDTVGGLDRYYRSLFEALPEASGVVIGPAVAPPSQISVVADAGAAGVTRIAGYWLAVRRRRAGCELIDAHFALYAAATLRTRRHRRLPTVFHFHGPWADESVASGDASRLRFVARRALERRTLRRADAFVVLSAAFRRVLVERYRVPPWDVHVWHRACRSSTSRPATDPPRARDWR
jgi:glycosyltransferase involved in cell wall biosynthesis